MAWYDQDAALPSPASTGQNAYNAATNTAAAPAPIKAPEPSPEPAWWQSDLAVPGPGRAAMSSPSFGQTQVDPQAAGTAKREAGMASATKAAEGPIDFQHGVPGVGTGFNMASINNPQDRAKQLIANGLEAKVITPEGSPPMTIWRKPGETAWHPISGTEVSGGDVGAGLHTGATMLPQVAAAIASPEGAIARILIQGLTGAAINLGEGEIQKLRGFNTEGPLQQVEQAGEAGLTMAGAEAAATPVAKALTGAAPLLSSQTSGTGAKEAPSLLSSLMKRFVSTPGQGFEAPEAGKALAEAAQAEGAPAPLISQIESAGGGQGGLISARMNQVLSTNPGLRDRVLQPQKDFLFDKTLAARDAATGTNSAPILDDSALAQLMRKSMADAGVGVPNPEVPASQGGKALQSGLEDFKNKAVEWRGDRYNQAIDASQGATYQGQPLIDEAKSMEGGVQMHGAPTQSGIDEATGKPITTSAPVTVGGSPQPPIQTLIDKIKQLDPNMRQLDDTSAYEGLKTINTQLGNSLSSYPAGGTSGQIAEFKQAQQLQAALQRVIENPTSANRELAQKISAASNSNKFVSKILDNPDMQMIMKTQSPEDIMNLARPENFTTLQALKRVTPPAKWATYQDAFLTQLKDDPQNVESVLKGFEGTNSRTLDLLAKPQDVQAIREWAFKIKSINSSDLAKLSEQSNLAARLPSLVKSDPAALRQLDPDMARAAVMQHILNESQVPFGSRYTVDPAKYAKVAGDLVQSGALKGIFSPGEIQSLTNLSTYARGVGTQAMDTGTSLQRASMAKNLFEWLHPGKWIHSLPEPLFNAIQARTMTSPAATKLFYGAKSNTQIGPRIAADALGAALNDMRNREQNPAEGGS